MIANSSRWRALHWALAPTSRTTVRPARFGTTAASAGRSTSSRVPSTTFAIVQQAAVFPAEKNASAWPSRTRSRATWIDERLLRVERATFSAMPTASGASTTLRVPVAPRRASTPSQQALGTDQRHRDAQLASRPHGSLHHHLGAVVAAHGVHGHPGLGHSYASSPPETALPL